MLCVGTQMGRVLVNSWFGWTKWMGKILREHEETSKRRKWLILQPSTVTGIRSLGDEKKCSPKHVQDFPYHF